jgi:hypothetical protein
MSEDVVAGVVASRRLGAGAGPRHSFTVERTEARLRLRERPGEGPWHFSLVLVRAVLSLVEFAEVDATTTSSAEAHTLELRVAIDPEALAGFEIGTVFDEALQPDPGVGDGSLAARQTRARRLLARAVNEALAAGPRQVDLETPGASRSFVRRAASTGDPFVERTGTATRSPGVIVFRIALDRTVGRWFEALRFGGDGLFAPVLELWRERVPGLEPRSRGAGISARADPRVVELGDFARLWGGTAARNRRMLRDGVLMGPLDAALREAGVEVDRVDAIVECPALQLTVDEGNIVRDGALATLVAWLHDASAHASGSLLQATWPKTLESVATAAGQPVTVAQLAALGAAEQPLPFVWRHEATALPLAARGRVMALWPSELAQLGVLLPSVRWVSAQIFGDPASVAKADLTALAQGSFPPRSFAVPPWSHGGAPALAVDAVAYVHRHGVATGGAVWLLALDRTLARSTDADTVMAGVTLVARVTLPAERAALARDVPALRELAKWVARHAEQRRDELVAHAFASSTDPATCMRAPLVAHAIAELDARALELRYVPGDAGARLTWRDDARLVLPVASTRDGAPRTLRDALERARDTGGVVVGEATRRWYVLEVSDAAHDTWIPTSQGLEVLERVLGRQGLWVLPTVPQAHPHAAPAASQPGLLLDRDEVARLLLRSGADVHARAALLAHLLVARATDRDALGLADVGLLHVYDPRAVTPDRIVSVTALRGDPRTFAIVPPGTATRDLPGPVVVAGCGEAALLHEVLALPLVPVPDGSRRHAVVESSRAAAATVPDEPVLRWPVADALAVGALSLGTGGARASVELWARGLHVGALELPAPFTELGGRLWLSDAGVRAARPAIEALVVNHARAIVAAARTQAELAPSGSARRRTLERFVAHALATASAGDDRFGLRALLPTPTRPRVLSAEAASAARLPSLRRLWLGALVRHALGRSSKVDRAWLSWRVAKLADAAAVTWEIEIGGRHRWIRRAVEDDAGVVDVQLAAIAIVAEVGAQAGLQPVALAAAMLRIVATAHVTSRT